MKIRRIIAVLLVAILTSAVVLKGCSCTSTTTNKNVDF